MSGESPILEARHLTKIYPIRSDRSLLPIPLTAVSDVSFSVQRGETFGIVGESGCGKSTLARLIMCLEEPTQGQIFFDGEDIGALQESRRRPLRPHFQMVFQDSGTTLNPRKCIGDLLRDPMLQHKVCSPAQANARIAELLSDVGLPASVINRYPHEFSGGQRQRICIAKALSLNPDLIILDEPVSALDVSVQAQILNLLQDLQKQRNLTYVFISHGLGAIRYICHRIAVMYRGMIVETGDCETLFSAPAHPYTRALIDAAPTASYAYHGRPRTVLQGEVGDDIPKDACPLINRCPQVCGNCRQFTPHLLEVPGSHEHTSMCLRALSGS